MKSYMIPVQKPISWWNLCLWKWKKKKPVIETESLQVTQYNGILASSSSFASHIGDKMANPRSIPFHLLYMFYCNFPATTWTMKTRKYKLWVIFWLLKSINQVNHSPDSETVLDIRMFFSVKLVYEYQNGTSKTMTFLSVQKAFWQYLFQQARQMPIIFLPSALAISLNVLETCSAQLLKSESLTFPCTWSIPPSGLEVPIPRTETLGKSYRSVSLSDDNILGSYSEVSRRMEHKTDSTS